MSLRNCRKNWQVTRCLINDFSPNEMVADVRPVVNSVEKEEEKEEENSVVPKNKNRGSHVCKHCNKSFNSGRALGGHIRIHGRSKTAAAIADNGDGDVDDGKDPAVSATAKHSSSKSKPGVEEEQEEEDANGGSIDAQNSEKQMKDDAGNGPVTVSSNISKAGVKMVSLYGLRSNPKRSGRVMDPEFRMEHLALGNHESIHNPSSAYVGNVHINSVVGCSESGSGLGRAGVVVGSWSLTRARSGRIKRNGETPAAAPPPPENDRDTANLLVILGNSRVSRESTEESVFHERGIESQGSFKGLSVDYDGDDQGGGGEQKFKGFKKPRSSYDNDFGEANCEIGVAANKSTSLSINIDSKKRNDDGNRNWKWNSTGDGYRCSTCNKVFNSHQALGGHRSSHRKGKGKGKAQVQAQAKACSEGEEDEDEDENVNDNDDSDAAEEEMKEEYHNGKQVAAEAQSSSHQESHHDLLMTTVSSSRNRFATGTGFGAAARNPDEDYDYDYDEAADIGISQLTGQSLQQLLLKQPSLGHQCSVCLKVFQSGQALGGHMRCHRVSANTATANRGTNNFTGSVALVSGSGQVQQQQESCSNRKRRFSSINAAAAAGADEEEEELFDLNQLPPDEEDFEQRFGSDHEHPSSAQSANQRVRYLHRIY